MLAERVPTGPGVVRISRMTSAYNRYKTMCDILLRCAYNWLVLCAIPVDSIRVPPIYSQYWESGLNCPSCTESAEMRDA